MPWTSSQEHAFALVLLGMGELFETPVSHERIELFTRAVEDLPFEAIREAANRYARAGRFFPKPVDLREQVLGDPSDIEARAELAWSAVLREVRRVGYMGIPSFPDETTERAAVGLFGGGWRTLCECLPAAGPELIGYRKQFVALYAASTKRAQLGILPPTRAEAKAALDGLTQQLEQRGLPTGALGPRRLPPDAQRAAKQVAALILDQVHRVDAAEAVVANAPPDAPAAPCADATPPTQPQGRGRRSKAPRAAGAAELQQEADNPRRDE